MADEPASHQSPGKTGRWKRSIYGLAALAQTDPIPRDTRTKKLLNRTESLPSNFPPELSVPRVMEHSLRPRRLGVTLSLYLALSAPLLCVEANNLLPNPTGPYPVGRVSYYWIDSARPEPLAAASPAYRELMVDIWYPAETTAGKAPVPYLPDLASAEKLLGEAVAKKQFGAAYNQIVNRRLSTHAQEGAPFAAPSDDVPVLIFSHGLGVLKTGYTAQLEDLASHGFVVAAIAHTYDTWLVAFPDGRVVRFDQERRKASNGSERASIQYEDSRMQVWATDIRFTIDQLTRYDRETEFQDAFQGHLDLARLGAFGHSAGGRAAALACQTDARIRACLNMDGVADNWPFYRDVQGNTMSQPFLLFVRKRTGPPPSDEELARMGYAREDLAKLIQSIDGKQDERLKSMPAGSYRITLSTPGANHMNFSDEPLLEPEGDDSLRNQEIVRTYTRAFFEKTPGRKKEHSPR